MENFSIRQLEFISDIKKQMRKLVDNSEDLALIHTKDSPIVTVIQHDTGFFFQVSDFTTAAGKTPSAKVSRRPTSAANADEHMFFTTKEGVETSLAEWAKLAIRYREIHSELSNDFETTYIKEFETIFNVPDENADKVAFEHEHQDVIYEYLEQVKLRLNRIQDLSDEVKNELIKDVDRIISTLSTNTKKEVTSKMAKFAAKLKVKGYKFFKEVLGGAVKKITTDGLIKGIKYIGENVPVDDITNLL